MSDNLPSTICMLPWVSIETSPVGTARPCCLADNEIVDSDGVKYNLKTSNLENIYNSDYMSNLRQSFLKGDKPQTCRRCWEEEAAGRQSKRINSKIRLKDYYTKVDWYNLKPDQLWFIDLKLGNICNLKCRICGSWSSSKWAKEEIDYLADVVNRKDHAAYQFLKDGAWPRESPEFWVNLKNLLPNVKYIEFTGGEPFLIEQHFDLLRFAVEHEYSRHIEIHYNTNGTVFPKYALDIWKEFKQVEVAFSIDNTGERFEYERYGANWNEVQENVKKFNSLRSRQFKTQICLTVNIQNVYYLYDLCNWIDTQNFDSVHFNMLHDPYHMNIAYMTPGAKELVINHLSSLKFPSKFQLEILRIVQFIKNGVGSDGSEFCLRMALADKYRNQNFLDSHKEIAIAMGYGKA